MAFLEHLLVFLHLLGLAGVLGGFLVQMKSSERKILPVQWHGILTQVVTGVLLAGVVPQVDGEVAGAFYVKITTKLVLALVALVLIAANRKRDTVTTGVWATIGAVEIVNVAIAVFWAL
ncbi:MAG: hypothetical protein WAN48_15505 [Actinomycetes bacterium]